METLASVWASDPSVLSDLGERTGLSTTWEAQCLLNGSPPAGQTWTEQFSPHIQRNKQLRDTLLQREEELARLQEENLKLREFLSSSYVRDLEEKAKQSRMKLKRNLRHEDERTLQTAGHHLMFSKPVSKRVCRNLTAQFCSDSSELPSESNLDLWVLKTLGLKDRDTIDSSDECTSPVGGSLRSLVYDSAVSSFSCPSSDHSFSQSSATSTPSTHCQSYTLETDYVSSPVSCQDPGSAPTYCSGQSFNFTAVNPTDLYEAPGDVTRSFNSSQLPANNPGVCPITAFSEEIFPEEQPSHRTIDLSPLEYNRTPVQNTGPFSPSASRRRLSFSPVLSSTPIPNKQDCCPLSPSAGLQPPATPRSRTDLAFRMSLSPSNSVKTHSFPQGQAFVSKGKEGGWNFTWLPRQNS